MVHDLRSNYNFFYSGDSYQDYAIARHIVETGKYSIINWNTGIIPQESPSSWPIIHILAAVVQLVSSVNLLQITLILPTIFGFTTLLFVLAFARRLRSNSIISERAVLLCALIYVLVPDLIDMEMQFIRQTLAFVFIVIIIYFLVIGKLSDVKKTISLKHTALFLFFGTTLILTHDFTPFVLLLFLGLFYAISIVIGGRIKTIGDFKPPARRTVTFLIVFTFGLILLFWWSFYASIIWKIRLHYLTELLSGHLRSFSLLFLQTTDRFAFYNFMSNRFLTYFLNARDLAVYLPTIVIYILLWIKVFKKKRFTFLDRVLLFSFTSFLVILVLFTIAQLEPLRIVVIASPIVALSAAVLYDHALSFGKFLIKAGICLVLFIMVFASFLAPWSHFTEPLYLYTPSITFEDAASHNPNYQSVSPFIEQYMNLTQSANILSDDHYLLYLLLPTSLYPKIGNLHMSPSIMNDNTSGSVIFEFANLNPSFYYLKVITDNHPEVLQNLGAYKQQIYGEYDVVYTSGSCKIYRPLNSSTAAR